VPSNLKRYYGHDDLHFITFSCYQRRPLLGTAPRRDLLLKILEQRPEALWIRRLRLRRDAGACASSDQRA
jgi:hypothetical protein